jgi:hypothetical protein
MGMLYFGPFKASITFPYPFIFYLPFFNSFQYTSLYPLPSHFMFYDIIDALSFSFPFPLFPTSIEYSNKFYIWGCIWSWLFLCMFIFWIYLLCMRKNVYFWAWFMSCNMMSFSCIHLPSNHMSLFLVAK